MAIQVTAFAWVPAFAQGYVRDLRVRWALEEAGLPYQVVLVDRAMKSSAAYRNWQPFAQVPAYKDDEVEMFESAAIVLHIAGKSAALMPGDAAGRAKVAAWVLAAVNSVEPFAQNFISFEDDPAGGDWAAARKAEVKAALQRRLTDLSARLGAAEYLEGRFSAADLMMVMVLRELVESGVLAGFANLDDYVRRGEARPGFAVSLAAQLRTFQEHAPAGR